MSEKLKLYTFIVAFGGILIGFNIAGLYVAKPMVSEYFDVLGKIVWLAVLAGIPGFLIGTFTIGKFADKYGRRFMLKINGFLYIISIIGCGLSENAVLFVSFQIFNGLAIGSLSVLSPLYISEISPAAHKIKLISLFPLFALTGLLTGFGLSLLVNNYELNIWYWIFIPQAIPATIFTILTFVIPRSPHWLISTGLHGEAFLILSVLNPELSREKIDEIVNEIDKKFDN